MIINAISRNFISFQKNIPIDKINAGIIQQLPANGKFILSADEEGDTLEITQGDSATKFITTFKDGKKVSQKESYNGKPAILIRFDEDGNQIIDKEEK